MTSPGIAPDAAAIPGFLAAREKPARTQVQPYSLTYSFAKSK